MANDSYPVNKFRFKYNLVTVLPPEFRLVTKNVFNGKVREAGTFFGVNKLFGFENVFISWFPWLKTMYVSALSEAYDFPERNYITKDRVNLTVDIAIEKKIVDGGKYTTTTKTMKDTLKNYIDGAVRKEIIKYDVDQILDSSFDLNALIRPELDNFERLYGLRIERVILQNFRLPDNIVKSLEKKFTAATDTAVIRETGRANADVQEMMDNLSIRKSKADAGVAVSAEKARNENEINQMNQLLELIKNCGPEEFKRLRELAYPMLFNNGGSNHFFVQNPGGSGDSTNAITAAEEGKTKTR